MTDYENPRKNQRSWRTNGEIEANNRAWSKQWNDEERSLRDEIDTMRKRITIDNHELGILKGWIVGVVMSAVLYWITRG